MNAGYQRWKTSANSSIHGLTDMVLSMLVGQHLCNQPIDEFMAILDSCLAEAQVGKRTRG